MPSNLATLDPKDLPQQSADLVMLCCDRWTRSTAAMEDWANRGKRAVDYVEGKQWTAEALKKAADEDRPALTFNKIAPLIRLILGYHRNNRVDAKFLPDDSGVATDLVAQALTKLCKRVSENNQETYIDTEVFMDGILTGRAFYDHRLDFSQNILGEMKVSSRDSFTVKLDPDGEEYDLNGSCNFVAEDRWVSVDEIEQVYGKGSAALIYPLVYRSGYGGMPTSLTEYTTQQVTPWRTFGGQFDRSQNGYMGLESYVMNCFDRARKTVRLVDFQHKVKVWRRFIADLETGDMEPVPDSTDDARLKEIMAWTEKEFAAQRKPNPLRVMKRLTNRMRWTTMVGDIIVYDKWSPYETYTMTGFFPWFRRGSTRGAVDDLIDPQNEVNKRRSANIDIVTRTAHSGWMYHEQGMNAEEQIKLENYGATPGINIKWKGEAAMKPERITAATPPMAFERLEQRGADDLKEISGVNNELLGMDETVKSGRAIEARQRQGVMAIQIYMDNMSRTKELCTRKKLEIIQAHYTEARMYRVTSDQGHPELLAINQKVDGIIRNNVTLGKYKVSTDETPLSATFAAAQLEEITDMVEKGILPKEVVQDVIIDLSSLPHKDAIKKRTEMIQKAQGMPSIEELEAGQSAQLAKNPNGDIVSLNDPSLQQPAAAPQQPADPMHDPDFLWKTKLLEAATKIITSREVSKKPDGPAVEGIVNAAATGGVSKDLHATMSELQQSVGGPPQATAAPAGMPPPTQPQASAPAAMQ